MLQYADRSIFSILLGDWDPPRALPGVDHEVPLAERDRLLKLCKILAATTRPGCLSVSTDKRSGMLGESGGQTSSMVLI